MDFRFERGLFEFLDKQQILGNADIVGWAGAGKAFLDEATREFALKQVELSHKLHHICEIHVIQHRDCGGYGGSSTFQNPQTELLFHRAQVEEVRHLITERFPEAQFKVYGHFADFSESDSVNIIPLEKDTNKVNA